MHAYIHIYIHTYTHTDIYTHIIHTYINTYIYTYIYSCIHVSVAEWLAWLTSNCGRIGAIASNPSNGLRPNKWGQKGFNPLCQCVYIYVCIVKPDIQTIHRCSHTSIHTCIHTDIHRYILFNDALNTFYFTVIWRQTYGNDQWDSERKPPATTWVTLAGTRNSSDTYIYTYTHKHTNNT